MSDDLADFLQQVVNGLSTSSIYVLLGVGLTLIFGLSRLINFAHGQFLVLGGFITWTLVDAGVPYALSVVLVVAIVGVLGVLSDRLLFRRNLANPMNGFVASLGAAIALQAVMVKIWSADIHQIEKPVSGVWRLGGVNISAERVLAVAITIGVVLVLFLLLDRSHVGRSLQAAAENPDAALLVGVNVGSSISIAFLLGSGLAALGGALIGMLFPFTAFTGGPLIIKGFAVALVGGLGNVRGAAVAGLALGLVETFGAAYGVPLFGLGELGPEWRDAYAFVLMIGLLALRPQGLFGTATRV